MSREITLDEESFERELLATKGLFVVEFRAEWCGSCHIMAPVIKDLAKEFEGRIKVGSLDVDENPGISARHGIRTVPCLLFFIKGELVGQIVGAVSKKELAEKIAELLQGPEGSR